MSEEKKIVVDEDWKEQVAKEKEAYEKQSANTGAHRPEMPEATFGMLVTTLAMQASTGLGQIPDPVTNKPSINKSIAKHFIDTLAMLEEKTNGNLSEQESELLTSTLHQLRMAFVATPDRLPEDSAESGETQKASTIELP